MAQALLSEHLLLVQFPVPGTIVKVLGPLWPMDAWKRASPIQTVIVSQVHCLISHFSGRTDVVGLVCRIGFVCSSCWENLGSGMRGGRGEARRGCRQKGGGGHGQELPARLAGALYHKGQGPAPSLVPAAPGSRLPP